MKYLFAIIVVSCCGLITACTGLNSEFSCSKKPGVMCSSLDQVNTMVDQSQVRVTAGDLHQTQLLQTPTVPIWVTP